MTYLALLDLLYIDALRDAAQSLAEPRTNFGIPVVYFAATMLGYSAMRFVDFFCVGAKCKAKKPLEEDPKATEKKMTKCTIKEIRNDGDLLLVSFGAGMDNTALLPRSRVFPDGWAPPDWFKQLYNLAQVALSIYTALFGVPVVFDMIQKPFGVGLSLDPAAPANKVGQSVVIVVVMMASKGRNGLLTMEIPQHLHASNL